MPKDKTKRKARNELPLEKRFQIVEEYENSKGLTGVRKLAEKFGCGKIQVSKNSEPEDSCKRRVQKRIFQCEEA